MKLPPPAVVAARRVSRWRDECLDEPQHSDRVAATLGLALGVCFTVSFLTGVLSHLIQQPPGWFEWIARPAGLYRVTQGVHVATGIASIPLLFAKLWSVFPRLFQWPLARDWAHALERLSLVPLIGGAIFLVVTGTANIELWYPWVFFFPSAHYAVAFITIGGLIIHVVAKIHITRRELRRAPADAPPPDPVVVSGRRRFLGLVAALSGALVLATVGQTVSPLRRLSLLAPRRTDIGVQGFPVNKSASAAGVAESSIDPSFLLSVESGGDVMQTFDLAALEAMPQRTATLPIACVEGWSTSQTWTGVPIRSLVELVGANDVEEVTVESLQPAGRYRRSTVNRNQLDDLDTLLALRVNGEPLAPDHGFPVRLIGPNRPGVLQTKWVARVVLA